MGFSSAYASRLVSLDFVKGSISLKKHSKIGTFYHYNG